MYRSTFLILLCFAWATADDFGVQRPTPVISRAGDVCTHSGDSCSKDCTQVLLCIDRGDGTYTQIVLASCTAPEFCSLKYGNCSQTELSCKSASLPFQCTGPGYFPDPYDCTVYHICLIENGESYDAKCDGDDHAYDSLTTACSQQLTSRSCVDGRFPPCTHVGQTGIDPDNPSIYYVCIKDESGAFVYWLYRCEYGWNYNPSTYTCEPTSEATTQTTSSTSSSETTTTPPPIIIGGHCDNPGVYPDEENCNRYYLCTQGHIWEHYACFIGFHFSRVHLQCVLGLC